MPDERPTIRELRPQDRAALAAFPQRVSSESAMARFHGALAVLTDRTLDQLLDLEPGRHEAYIGLDDRGIVGVARYVRDDDEPTVAEVAILVADEWQHRGVAQAMVTALSAAARGAGIRGFRAAILPGNVVARAFFTSLGPVTSEDMVDGEVVITIEL